MTPVIQIHDVSTGWPRGPRLGLADLAVNPGERVFLRGPSGSGKSTLLHLLAGLLPPRQGAVSVLGRDLYSLSARQRDRFRARNIGVIFQQFNLIPYLSVADNMALARAFGGGREPVEPLLERLRLDPDILQRPARSLSIGQQQRVAIARVLVNRPPLILADEPTSALDADARDVFMQLLRDCIEATGGTLMFVSHDHSLEAYFDRTLDTRELLVREAS